MTWACSTGYRVTALGPNPGQDNNNQAQPYAVVLPAGGRNLTADFGYIQPGAIGDYVWYDTDADGIQDVGEPGIGNVTVDLYRIIYIGRRRHRRNWSRARSPTCDGGYIFTGLVSGVYFVDVTRRAGLLAGLTHTPGPQSQPDPTGPHHPGAGPDLPRRGLRLREAAGVRQRHHRRHRLV